VTLGPLLGGNGCLTPPCRATPAQVSSNRFSVLASSVVSSTTTPDPEYAPLILLRIRIWDGSKYNLAYALVDSGAQGSIINREFAEMHNLPFKVKSKPMKLILADGESTRDGEVTHYVPVKLKVGDHEEILSLDVSTIGYDAILGLSWLKKHNPAIKWSDHSLSFPSPHCRQHCLPPSSSVEAPVVPPRAGSGVTPSLLPKNSCSLTEPLGEEKIVQRDGSRKVLPPRNLSDISRPKVQRKPPPVAVPVDRTAPKVSLIGAAAFAQLLKPGKGNQLFTMSFENLTREVRVATQSALNATQIANLDSSTREFMAVQPGGDRVLDVVTSAKRTFRKIVPPEYREFEAIFSKAEANKLPQHRSYDHRIPLEEGTSPPYGPIYSLSPIELDTLRKYIEENLRRGFIRHSQSPCGAPVLFVKKADGSLRLCIDYRGLNKISIKNRYPLPLIGELLERLAGAKFFTKLDMREGYYLLRMAKGEEWKTAFRCRYGLFEYQVMPFGLCNAPGTFQHFVNDTFSDYLDKFLAAYLDDLLIYSNSLKEHKAHVRLVLERLQSAGLYVKAEKCLFHVTEVPFLGYLISKDGIRMDPEKVASVVTWPAPRNVHDIQCFLGFANFYRRFIKDYSHRTVPITRLLRKDVKFEWTEVQQEAFDDLKTAFTSAPILQHFDRSRPAVVEADASDYAMGAVLSQKDELGVLHPCAFFSRKFVPAEQNYEIYDKEMLVIVEAMEGWRHHLEGSGNKITVFSDHKNLLWFAETKVYNRRQARWAEKLSRFDFTIIFRPGKHQGKPDALSRRPDYLPLKGGGGDNKNNEFLFLKPHQVDLSLLPEDSACTHLSAQSIHLATAVETLATDDALADAIKVALPRDPNIGPYLKNLHSPELPRSEDVQAFLEPFSIQDGLVLRNGLVYIPDENSIKLRVLKSCHDAPSAGHLGEAKTLGLITRDYYWPRMRQYVNEYVKSCDTCTRNKTPRQQPHGPLHPLPIPSGPWTSVSMDFIVELPPSDGFDAIYVCVDRFTKLAHFIPTTVHVTAEETAKLYLRHVFKHHGIPDNIISDRGVQFTSRLTASLLELCNIQGNKSTAYHPQSDGQTERVNQVLEQFLRIFCDYQQSNWNQLLSLAEFAYNNAKHSSTQVSPFFANYGRHPRCTLRIIAPTTNNPAAEDLVTRLGFIHGQIKQDLAEAQAKYKLHFDRHVKALPDFKVGDLVWLSRRNISTTRPSAKLDYRRLGPFKILECVGESKLAFKLELPHTMRIHPVFHGSLLTPYRPNTLPGRIQPPAPSIAVDGHQEYEVQEILDSKIERGKLRYLVDWVGWGPEDRQWEPAEYLENAADAVARFHARCPLRPSPADIPRPVSCPTTRRNAHLDNPSPPSAQLHRGRRVRFAAHNQVRYI
jgi:RNase H-like domain found in reverse transcriptase/Reverse transcriptase (RNA-dependent DNA polymerase)/Integrase zinc binding domain/Chromo (CHRromatin Organisation MOdifier) domain/gag-polyprotein putative aspartyl protease